MVYKSLNCLVPEYLTSEFVMRNQTIPFRGQTTWKIGLVTAAQPFETAYTVTLENLIPKINLNALSIKILTEFMEIRSVGAFLL